jgi:hypothetical protein
MLEKKCSLKNKTHLQKSIFFKVDRFNAGRLIGTAPTPNLNTVIRIMNLRIPLELAVVVRRAT